MKTRGSATIIAIVLVALLGGGLFVFRPAFLHGDSRRAKESAAATVAVERTAGAQGGAAAASIQKIGEANQEAPLSPSRDFIAREVPLALSYLPKPDPAKLLEAERRKVAVMEGQIAEARRLYEDAAKTSAALQRERDAALAARRAVDAELAEVAAARLAAERQRAALVVVAVLLLAAWIYAKFFGISAGTLGRIAADVRSGVSPIAAMDEALRMKPWLHGRVNRASRLATPTKD